MEIGFINELFISEIGFYEERKPSTLQRETITTSLCILMMRKEFVLIRNNLIRALGGFK